MKNARLITQAVRIASIENVTEQVYNNLRKRARLAGVKDFSPQDLRRTYAGDLLEAGVDISLVSRMAGHAGVQTTARYDSHPEQAKRKPPCFCMSPINAG
jgi:site-specific recombinase XerD